MIVKVKKVYYCEHCRKKGLSASSLSKHEKYCTGNLNRKCRMCEEAGSNNSNYNYKELIEEFQKQVNIQKYETEYGISYNVIRLPKANDILDSVDGCPACALTIIRHLDTQYQSIDFNYSQAVESFWSDINQREHEREMSNYYC